MITAVPGLLLSFAARLDAAKSLVAIVSGGRRESPTGTTTGGVVDCDLTQRRCCSAHNYYFVPLVIAYAIGLLMANVAVYVMNMGQPALLYLVPCTLGTMCYLGYQRHELKQLWEGPRVLQTADQLVYGTPTSTTTTSPVPPEAGSASPTLDEFVDDETGDVPLLSSTTTTTNNNDSQNHTPTSH
jgi:signal peptide peptidase-like protein 2B